MKDKPRGLNACDVAIVEREGGRRRIELTERRINNDQIGEGDVIVGYADEQCGVPSS